MSGQEICELGLIEKQLGLANSVYQGFQENTFTSRASFYYFGSVRNDWRGGFASACKLSSKELEKISEELASISNRIETYPGQDWEERFGKTGIWKKSCQAEMMVKYLFCEVEYWGDIAKKPDQQTQSFCDLCRSVDEVLKSGDADAVKLLKAKVYGFLGRHDERFTKKANEIFADMTSRNSCNDRIYFLTNLEKANLGLLSRSKFEKVQKQLVRSDFSDDAQLRFGFACMGARLGSWSAMNDVISRWPELRTVAGKFALVDFEADLSSVGSGSVKAELAGYAAIENFDDVDDSVVPKLISLCGQSKTGRYLEYLNTDEGDVKTQVGLLLSCLATTGSGLHEDQYLDSESIACLAVEKCYDRLCVDKSFGGLTVKSLEAYLKIAGDDFDEQLVYLAGIELADILPNKSKTFLQKLTERKNGKLARRAQVDSLLLEFNRTESSQTQKLSDLAQRVEMFLKNNKGELEFADGLALYCEVMLEIGKADRLAETLKYFDGSDCMDNPYLPGLKAQILCKLNRVADAVGVLASNFDPEFDDDFDVRVYVLWQGLSDFEVYESGAGEASFCKSCETLSGQCVTLNSADKLADILNKEMAILSGRQVQLANDLDFYAGSEEGCRMLARMFMAEKKYELSAGFWAKVANFSKKIQKNMHNNRSWPRAKYYQHYCCRLSGKYSNADLIHGLDVVLKQISEEKGFWEEKISNLKNTLSNAL